MAFEDTGGKISLGTEAWNVADAYVKLKILKQLVLCDKLETIALYGHEDIDEEGFLPENSINYRRVNALNRLKDNLKQMFSNVAFAIYPSDQAKFDLIRMRLKIVEDMLIDVSFIKTNQATHEDILSINEEWFALMFTELQEIKESVHIPLNNAGLIFRNAESMDFDEMVRDIEEGG